MDKLSACRICGNKVSVTHCIMLFSRESLAVNTPEQLSRMTAVLVIQYNGLCYIICCPCKRKFQLAESFQDTARVLTRNLVNARLSIRYCFTENAVLI